MFRSALIDLTCVVSDCHLSDVIIKKFIPLRAKKIFIRKAEYWPYLGFSYKKDLSVTL